MLFNNEKEVKDVAKSQEEKDLWEEEKVCFKAGFMTGIATAGGIALAGLALIYKICKK